MQPNLSTQLDLLVPWDLPIAHSSPDQLRSTLEQLLQILLNPTPESTQAVNQLFVVLDAIEVAPAEVASTKTALKYWEVEDFDTYFNVRHVQTDAIAICLVKGVLQTCHTFFELKQSSNQLDPKQVDLQLNGFISYIKLLRRVFEAESDDSI
jgi:hypothetical protein